MGVWIETHTPLGYQQGQDVTPFVGVWIETSTDKSRFFVVSVTPFVGVWIETLVMLGVVFNCGHTLRGCVD